MSAVQFRGAVFDLDGTLIDSMPFFFQALAEALSRRGAAPDQQYFLRWHGQRQPMELLLKHHGLQDVDRTAFLDEFGSNFTNRVRESVQWIPQAEELLQNLRDAGVPMGVLTNAPPRHLEAANFRLGLDRYCGALVTPADVGFKSKPAPDGLLHTVQRLGLTAAQCIYVGDQHFDLLAARNAGTGCIFLRSQYSGPTDIRPDFEFTSILDVRTLFGGLHGV